MMSPKIIFFPRLNILSSHNTPTRPAIHSCLCGSRRLNKITRDENFRCVSKSLYGLSGINYTEYYLERNKKPHEIVSQTTTERHREGDIYQGKEGCRAYSAHSKAWETRYYETPSSLGRRSNSSSRGDNCVGDDVDTATS